jgi:hypothetical protein
MTSVTYGMLRSLCKVAFDTYQGALTSFLSDFGLERLENFCVGRFAASPQFYSIGPDRFNYRVVYDDFVFEG